MNRLEVGVVVTSIAAPNEALKQIAAGCRRESYGFWVIGDVPSPADFSLTGCEFVSVPQQLATGFRFAKLCPLRHYARKNIGYLLAIQAGTQVLIETDDDNFPRPEFWPGRSAEQCQRTASNCGWVNVYRYFSSANIWPRGFPLDFVSTEPPAWESLPKTNTHCPIQQGLADENPDVDAVYRLVLPLPLRFDRALRVVLGAGAWCPFNSQNTTWFADAFPLLYLPAFCSFRMTDIWRSLVAQRICWENGWSILFHEPTVWQERNDHNLMRDFEDEIPGYLLNRRIADTLEKLPLRSGAGHLGDNLLKCYDALGSLGAIDSKELPLLEAWLGDLDLAKGAATASLEVNPAKKQPLE